MTAVPRPLHPGRPHTAPQVIPDGWAAAHAPVVTDTLDCTVTIGPAGGAPTFNHETRQTEVADAAPVYNGPASIASLGGSAVSDGTRAEAAGDLVDDRTYLIKLAAGDTSPIEVDHVVAVAASPNPRLDGARLLVVSTPRPGREFSRSLIARLYE